MSESETVNNANTMPEKITLFTFVRDPSRRMLSGFLTGGHTCSKVGRGVGSDSEKVTAEKVAGVLERFEDVLQQLDRGDCQNAKMISQMSRLPNLQEHPLDFVGS